MINVQVLQHRVEDLNCCFSDNWGVDISFPDENKQFNDLIMATFANMVCDFLLLIFKNRKCFALVDSLEHIEDPYKLHRRLFLRILQTFICPLVMNLV